MRSSLNRYALLAKRWAWLVILGVVVCAGVTYAVTKFIHPTYEASETMVLSITTSPSGYDNVNAAITIMPAYAQLVNSPAVLKPVADKHKMTLTQLSGMVAVKPQSNTPIIEVDVDNTDAVLAQTLATEIGQSFQQFSATQLGGTVSIQAMPVQLPTNAVRPKPTQDAALGALAGLGLAIALIVLFEWLDDRLARPEDLQEIIGLDTMTTIPELSRQQRMRNAEETPALAEGCRILCANLSIARAIKPFKLVLVTSALAGEGKSTIAANLASFLAMTGKRVLLVDADLRHPVLDQHFQLDNRQGLSNAFLEMWAQIQVGLDGQPTEIPSLRVLTSGVLPSNPSELLQSQLAQQMFTHFKETPHFDYVIFDTPPILPIADTQIIASYVEASILVVDASKTSRRIIMRAKQALSRTGTRILGVVVNKSRWTDYSDMREYLGNIQLKRPKADITMAMPPSQGARGPVPTPGPQGPRGPMPQSSNGMGPGPNPGNGATMTYPPPPNKNNSK